MSKITIETELLNTLNSALADREAAIIAINKANTDEKVKEVKPEEIVGDKFDAKELCGDFGDEGEGTISGCINTLGKEISEFVEGIIMVNEIQEERPRSSGGSHYTDPGPTETTPVVETPQEPEVPQEEIPAETPPEDEEVVVTPVTPALSTLISQFDTEPEMPSSSSGLGTITVTQEGATITDENGNPTGSTTVGQYKVYEELKDGDGNVIAVRVSPDGTEPEQWIRIVQDGNQIGSYYEANQVGSYNCTQDGITIYDKDNNPIGTLPPGNHKVYAIASDANSNVTAIRISKDGEPEQWVQIYKDGKYIDGGIFEQYGYQYTNPTTIDIGNNAKVTISGKRNKILGGVLGVLVVGLGATIYVKKKQENGNTVTDDESLPEGDYDIYDYHTDDEGNVKEARISDNNAPEEQWVEF